MSSSVVKNRAEPIVYLFPGQGSQFRGMGRELFEGNAVYRAAMLRLDDVCQGRLGHSVVEEIYAARNANAPFVRTLHTHPAIFMTEYALATALSERGVAPDYCVGASLGEFAAAVIAGALPVRLALDLVISQAQCLEAHCAQDGGMLAVLDDSALYSKTPSMYENSELAAVNSRGHFVLAGAQEGLRRVAAYLEQSGRAYQALPVVLGYHSKHIEPASRAFLDVLERTPELSQRPTPSPTVGLMSSRRGGAVHELSRTHFWEVAAGPMYFREVVASLEQRGAHRYVDLGPSSALSNLAKLNLHPDSKSKVYPIMSQFRGELSKFEGLHAALGQGLPARANDEASGNDER